MTGAGRLTLDVAIKAVLPSTASEADVERVAEELAHLKIREPMPRTIAAVARIIGIEVPK